MQICPASILPTLDGILNSFKTLFEMPPKWARLPNFHLPSLPNPLFGKWSHPSLEMVINAVELQAFQLQTTIMGIIKPLLDKLGQTLESFLPKIPGLAISLIDLLSGDSAKIVAAFKEAIRRGIHFPGVPWPLYCTLKREAVEVIHTMQMAISNYMQQIAMLIPNLIKQVTDKLKIAAMALIPKIPTPEEVLEKLFLLLGVNTLVDFIAKLKQKGLNIMTMLSTLTFPGMPPFPLIQQRLIAGYKSIEQEFIMGLTTLYTNFILGVLKPVMDFIDNTLKKFLNFTFPIMCITIPDIKIPDVPNIPIPIPPLPNF